MYRSMESISIKTVKMDDITSAESSKKTSTASTASNASTISTSTAYTNANSTSISTPTASDTSFISSSSNLSDHNSNEGLGKISRVRYTKRKSQIQRIRKKNEMFWGGNISYYTDKETTVLNFFFLKLKQLKSCNPNYSTRVLLETLIKFFFHLYFRDYSEKYAISYFEIAD